MKPNLKCTICNGESPKYKCPKCFIRYCSLNCYKSHKSADSCIQEAIRENITTKEQNRETKIEFQTEDTVPQINLKLLGESKNIEHLLANPHLREMLLRLTKSNDVVTDMNKAMQEPIFMELANKCIDVVNK